MGPEINSLIGGFPFLPGPLERSSTVHGISSKKCVLDGTIVLALIGNRVKAVRV